MSTILLNESKSSFIGLRKMVRILEALSERVYDIKVPVGEPITVNRLWLTMPVCGKRERGLILYTATCIAV